MKKYLQDRNEKLFKKLFEKQGITIKELGVPEMTAWQALEEEGEEETLEETQGVVVDPSMTADAEEEEELSDEESEELTKDAGI